MPLNNITVANILEEKSASVHSVQSSSTVDEAVKEMNKQRIGSLLIHDGTKPVGIFTERDVLVRVVASSADAKTTLVRDVMTSRFKTIAPDASLEDAMQLMTDARVRHLPVFEGETIHGMISIGDVTRCLLKFNQMEAENLRKYAFSDYPG